MKKSPMKTPEIWFLDMEGVRSSNLRASTSNNGELAGFLHVTPKSTLARFSPGRPAIIGTNSGQTKKAAVAAHIHSIGSFSKNKSQISGGVCRLGVGYGCGYC